MAVANFMTENIKIMDFNLILQLDILSADAYVWCNSF